MEPFRGSVEILSGDESRGIPGDRWTVETVPVVVGVIAGITDLTAVTPEPRPTGRTPEAQWSGTDEIGAPITVLLWRQRDEDINPPPFPNPEDE